MTARRIYLSILLLWSLPALLQAQYITEDAFPFVKFERPVRVQHDGVNDWLYVVEQAGRIKVVPNETFTHDAGLFLDITDRVFYDPAVSLEIGLLGLAFHPDYATNGYFYVYFLTEDPYRAVLARYRRSMGDPQAGNPDSEFVLLEIERQYHYHHGGDLAFGPDGYLYLSLGDGHPSNDGLDNAQNLTTLLGSIIRIDVDRTSGDRPYGIPPDNPFAGNTAGFREEIFAYGLRNPWRFSIDVSTGAIWVGNVGELDWEEINVVRAGGNYGWPAEAGGVCRAAGCDLSGYTLPVWSYGREITSEVHERANICVTGGYVYRGNGMPELHGTYIYSDCSSGILWALEYDGVNPATQRVLYETGRFVSSFGEDLNRELYLTRYYEGRIDRIIRADQQKPTQIPALALEVLGPNPFQSRSEIEVRMDQDTYVTVTLYNILGQEVLPVFAGEIPAQSVRSFSIDGAVLPAGVYFCRLTTGDQVMTRKLVVVR